MSRIFINYRRQDSEGYVGRLYDHLIQHFDRNDVFIDVDNIPPGTDFVTKLEEAVANCDVFIAVIGPQWLNITDEQGQRRLDQWDDFVRLEAAIALKQNKLIIPVLVGQARMPAPHQLPEDITMLARRNAIELSHQRFSYDVQKLIEAIRGAISSGQFLKTPADAGTRRQKETALKQLRIELIGATESPLYQHRADNGYFPVLGEGNPDAALLFIGESPGITEAQQGRPFIGPSGAVFDELLGNIHLQRSDVFVTNLLLDTPSAKRDPLPDEIAFYEPFVDRIIDIIQPVVLVTLGRFAMQYLLKKLDLPEQKTPISKVHGKLIKASLPYGEIHVVPLYHPAMVLYNPSQKATLRSDFERLKLFV